MSIPIGNLVIEMAINQARMIKDIEAAKKTVDTAMGAIKKSAELAAKSLGALGIGLSVGMFAEWVRGAIDAADRMNDLSKSTGIAVQNLAGLKLAAKHSGGDLDGIAASINKLSVNIGGNAEKFAQLGITAKDPLEAFKQLSDIFVGIQDPQLRAAVAAEALGKSWASAAPLLAEGGAKIGEMVDKGKALANITPEVAQAADQLNDTLAEISARSEGLKNQLMIALLPSLQRIADAMNETSMASKVMSLAIQGVGAIFDGLVFVGGTAINVLKTAGIGIREIVEMTAAIATGNGIDGVKAAYDKAGAGMAAIVADQVAFRESFLPKAQDDEMARLINRQSDAVRRNSGAIEENARAFLKGNEAKKEGIDLYAKMIKQADDLVASIQFETKLLTMNNVEKETAIALQKLATMGIKEGTDEYKKYSEAIIAATLDKAQVQSIIDSNKKIEEARLDAIKKADDARKKMEDDAAKQLRDISNQVGQSLADALMNGGKSAKQYLQDLFRTLILRPVVQPLITGTIASILYGAAGSASAGGIVGAAGGSSSMIGSLGALKNLYDMATGSFASLGDTVRNATMQIGSFFNGSESLSMANEIGFSDATVSLAQTAGSLGTIASALGGVGAGLGIGNLLSGGLGVGGSSWNTVGSGTAIGAAVGSIVPGLGTALGAAAGGILGGLVNKMFGSGPKTVDSAGVRGVFSAQGAGATMYSDWSKSGGWFSGGGSGTDLSPISAELQTAMNISLQSMSSSISGFIKKLGVATGDINGFTQDVSIALDGLTAEQQQAKITAALTGFGDALTTYLVPEIANFQKIGESSSAALNRLGTNLGTVNNVFGTLNLKLRETSLASANATSSLIELFGGLSNFTSMTDFYYQNFYSEQERAAKTTQQLTSAFKTLGLSMPDSKSAFRAMVEASNAAGNDTLFYNLMRLAPTFNDLEASLANIAATSATTAAATTGLDTAFSALQSSIQAAEAASLADLDRQKTIAQAAKDAASESVSALKSLFDYLKGQVSGLLQIADASGAASNGFAFISTALASAKSTGYLPDQSSLSDAVSAARGGLVSSNFSSSYDMRLAQMKLAADLQGLMDITGDRKTIAEQQLEVAQNQLLAIEAQAEEVKAYYAQQLAWAQTMVDQLRGVNSGVLSLTDAMAAFLGAVSSVRGYASGGTYPGGLAMVGERGPELINFKSPGTVYTAGQTQRMLAGGAETADEVRMLRQDNRAQAAAMVRLQAQMTKIFERWESDGIPETRVTA